MLFASIMFSGCLTSDRPVPVVVEVLPGNVSSSSSSSSNSYMDALSTKIVFNKSYFYNNYSPNSLGCAGDAKYYFDPLTDRMVPNKPNWLKNISLDITNSNALYGPSNATSCGLFGAGAAPASNCASFDDMQPNSGASSRSILVGGYGCTSASASCGSNENISDIWALNVEQTSSDTTWIEQATSVPILNTGASVAGLAWASGDYSEQEDAFYIFGGASPDGTTVTGTRVMPDPAKLVKISFNPDGSLNTTSTISAPLSTDGVIPQLSYGGWTTSLNTTLLSSTFSPSVTTGYGTTFTHGVRRDPTLGTFCLYGDNTTPDNGSSSAKDDFCPSTGTVAGSSLKNANVDQDYFLLLGGMSRVDGSFSKSIYAYKTRNLSHDLSPAYEQTGGDWSLLYGTSTDHADIMKQVALSESGDDSAPITIASTTWSGRAYHRTVYDPSQNRFYIFGGLTGSSASASTSQEMWVYDPPALGRRPTAACYSSKTPEETPQTIPLTSTINSAKPTDDINRNYFSNRMVFPPGGCLQKITSSDTVPDARFEQSMALDRDQHAVVVFGGCNTAPSSISYTSSTLAGDPTTNCNSSNALLNDTWIYLTPTTNEYVPSDYETTSGPYSSTTSTRLPNIFGTEFWTRLFPLYSGNVYGASSVSQPTTREMLGVWIELDPSTTPTKRVSANMIYDRAHHKFYLFGGYGCRDSSCSTIGLLNDLWEFTPPNIDSDCSRTNVSCSSQGTWKQIKAHNMTDTTQPPMRKGAVMAHAEPLFSSGDDFYTVTDSACASQGPLATGDPSSSKRYVGAIYIHLDRSELGNAKNLLINLRLLPYDRKTKLASISNNGTTYSSADDTDIASTTDKAVIRVRLLNSPIAQEEEIMSSQQPRFHDFIAGTPVISDQFVYVGGPSGQVTEKQILVPLTVDSSIDLIKIERVEGSVKFYEMTVTSF